MPLVFMGTKTPATLRRTASGTSQGVGQDYNRDTNPTNANGGVTWEGNVISPDGKTLYQGKGGNFSMVGRDGRKSNDGHHIDASLSDESRSRITENMTPYSTEPGSVKGMSKPDANGGAAMQAGASKFRAQQEQDLMGGAAHQEALQTGQAPTMQDGVVKTNDQGNLAFKNGRQVGKATFSDLMKNRKR